MSKDFEVLTESGDTEKAAMPPLNGIHQLNQSDRQMVDEETLRLVQQIFLLQSQEPPRVVVFAGVDHGNGCSQICTSVGKILAKNSRRPVCVVDANLRTPSLPEHFATASHPGLTEALLQGGPISSFAKPVDGTNLWLLPAGTLAVDSPNLLSAASLRKRIHELRQDFDFVIIDTPPLGQYSDALVLGQHSDGLVLVLEANSTRREPALAVVAGLRASNVNIIAAVLNKRTFPIPEKLYQRL